MLDDIIGDPGLSVVSLKIINYLNRPDLIAATKACKSWQREILQFTAIWQSHFKDLCIQMKSFLLRYYAFGFAQRDWFIFFNVLDQHGTCQDLFLSIQLMQKVINGSMTNLRIFQVDLLPLHVASYYGQLE